MKQLINRLVIAGIVSAASTGWAAYDFTGSGGSFTAASTGPSTIQDFPNSGVAFALNFNNSYFNSVSSVSVTFTTSGGWNGDLYAYLSHSDGIAVLLNRVGANAGGQDGYGTSGFNNITLTAGGTDIHTVASPTTGGTYGSDGRMDYTSGTRDNTLDVFNGVNPNGAWTLYFSDKSALNTSTLTSWSVDISAVPEPTEAALGLFGLVGGLAGLVRWQRNRRAA